MKVIKPVALTDAMVTTNAVESVALYNAVATYALGDVARLGHSLYKSVQAGNAGHAPETEPLWWTRTGPSNAWAMFDGAVSTQTTRTASVNVSLTPGMVNSLALFNLSGQALTVGVTNLADNTQVYSKTINLDGTVIVDWYQYFFEPYVQLGDIVLTDLPPYPSVRVDVGVTTTRPAEAAAVGHCSVGNQYALGDAQYGATAGITDYSVKTTDAFGASTLVQRDFSKRASLKLSLPTGAINKVQRALASLRSTPCAWVGVEHDPANTFAPLLVWGFYKDFSIDVAYATHSFCSLDIEGLS